MFRIWTLHNSISITVIAPSRNCSSYKSRPVQDVQSSRSNVSSSQPPSAPSSSTPATGVPPAPSRSTSAPLFSGSPIPPPSTPVTTQQTALLTPQESAAKEKEPQKQKKSQVGKTTEIGQSKRKEVEPVAGPSSKKQGSTKRKVDSDEYQPGETQIPWFGLKYIACFSKSIHFMYSCWDSLQFCVQMTSISFLCKQKTS